LSRTWAELLERNTPKTIVDMPDFLALEKLFVAAVVRESFSLYSGTGKARSLMMVRSATDDRKPIIIPFDFTRCEGCSRARCPQASAAPRGA
jgi:hypothetical protein